MTGEQLQFTGQDALAVVEDLDIVEGVIDASEGAAATMPVPVEMGDTGDFEVRNLCGEADRIAARAASAGTRRQYAAIYRRFAHWLREELGRPPVVGDLDADVIGAYARYLATAGGRGGQPAAPATARVYIVMVRSPASSAARTRSPTFERPVMSPDHPRRSPTATTPTCCASPTAGRWAVSATMRCCEFSAIADCAQPSCALRARDLRRPRSNARHFRLFVRGKGGREREVPVPDATRQALESWAKVHPLARGIALRDEDALFVRLGRHAHEDPVALSAEAVYRVVSRHALAAGIPGRLAHPHALRAYWATHCLEAGVPVHEVSSRLGHVDLRTTARYAATRPERVDDIADILDRHWQAARRQRGRA